MIPFARPLLRATFVRRDNRFRSVVLLEGQEVAARVANTGRLTELLEAGRPCYVSPAAGPARKTAFDLRLIAHAGILVSLDTHLPNTLFEDGLARGLVSFRDLAAAPLHWRREVTLGRSRIDFLLAGEDGRRCWVETKSVTLVEDGIGRFPDARTERGRRHLEELSGALGAGDSAALVFIVQRPDARAVCPHPTADPAFAGALRRAWAAGVSLHAYTCRVSLDGVELLQRIPVLV